MIVTCVLVDIMFKEANVICPMRSLQAQRRTDFVYE